MLGQWLCREKELYEAACSFVLSYAWLIRHESDFQIAHDTCLLDKRVTWEIWTGFLKDFLGHIDLKSLNGISPRFQYGELRLSRLNKIIRVISLMKFRGKPLVRGYMTGSTWYKAFFATHFGWLLAVFAVLEVCLSAMQVLASIGEQGRVFERTAYGFAITNQVIAALTMGVVSYTWLGLFAFHVSAAFENNRRVLRQRQRQWGAH